MFLMALVASLLLQDTPDELRKEIEKLKKQTVELQERLGLLEQAAVEDAQTIQRLRQVVKLLESNVPAEPSAPKSPDKDRVKPDVGGPSRPIKAKVVFVDTKQNFIALS